jgi:hypothetical protein
MRPEIELKPEFVEFIPDELEARTLYIAAKYRTVVHLCCCGCGRKVVTPLSPAAWKLTFDGVSITLSPSIGSWNLTCKSHYWIERNRVRWAGMWAPSQIEAGRASEAWAIAEYYGEELPKTGAQPASQVSNAGKSAYSSPSAGFWSKLWRRLFER